MAPSESGGGREVGPQNCWSPAGCSAIGGVPMAIYCGHGTAGNGRAETSWVSARTGIKVKAICQTGRSSRRGPCPNFRPTRRGKGHAGRGLRSRGLNALIAAVGGAALRSD